MVSVRTSDINSRISVKSTKETNVFAIKDNLSEYYARQAESWAHSEGMVNGIDYSSKYYAEQSKAFAQVADEAKTATQELTEGFDNNVQIAKDDIEQNRIDSINAIDNTYSVAIGDIQEKSDEVLTSIETLRVNAVDNITTVKSESIAEINSTKTTAVNTVNTTKDNAISSITTLSNDFIDEINATGKSYDNLTHKQITNCLLEVPQNINLELSDGVLTLKAGSKVIVPNGFEADGTTLKFDEVEITSDITHTQSSNGAITVYYSPPQNRINSYYSSADASGTDVGSNTNGKTYYDTDDNKVSRYDKGNLTVTGLSFPIARITVTNGAISSIDQIFNGFGYIGSTIWVDKGVKCLIPNGRNADGTLNNTEYTTVFQTYTKISGNTSNVNVFFLGRVGSSQMFSYCQDRFTFTVKTQSEAEKLMTDHASSSIIIYVEDTNSVIAKNSGGTIGLNLHTTGVVAVKFDSEYKITSFQPKLPFRAVDYNDFNNELQSWLPAGAIISSGSSSTPTGYLYCNGSAVSRTTYAKLFSAIGTTYGEGDGSTTFNLPNYSNYNFVTSATISVKGNGMTLGFTNGSKYGGKVGGGYVCYENLYGTPVGTSGSGGGVGNTSIGITTDPTKSGITGSVSIKKINWYIKY